VKAGDLVRFVCKDPRDIGMVVHVYLKHPDLEQNIDVLWDDGVWTHPADQVEVISAVR